MNENLLGINTNSIKNNNSELSFDSKAITYLEHRKITKEENLNVQSSYVNVILITKNNKLVFGLIRDKNSDSKK